MLYDVELSRLGGKNFPELVVARLASVNGRFEK